MNNKQNILENLRSLAKKEEDIFSKFQKKLDPIIHMFVSKTVYKKIQYLKHYERFFVH